VLSKRDVLTWPNLVTVVRLCCIPVFLWLLLGRDDRFWAAILLGALGATDWVDGYLARRFGQVSELGKILDPTADRLLFLVGIVALLVDGSVPVWFAVASLVREVFVAITALVLGALGARRIDVTWLGKCATFALMFAFPFFLASHAGRASDDVFEVLAWVSGIPGLVLSYYTLGQYAPLAREALATGRSARRDGPAVDSDRAAPIR
jgi:cardiolipin synthase